MRRRRLPWATLTITSALVTVACDLGLTPYVEPIEGGIVYVPPDATKDSEGETLMDAGTDSATVDASDGSSGGKKRVFVTSTIMAGNLGGIVGANNVCTQRALAGKLDGVFVAWISVAGDPIINRLLDVGPWYLPDRKTLVFNDKASIIAGPLVPIDKDESNAQVQAPDLAWTGTTNVGAVAAQNCNNFTNNNVQNGTVGQPSKKTAEWTQANNQICASQLHIYCFEQ